MDQIQILERLIAIRADGKAVALCTVISSEGSTPRHSGSKMLVLADGSFTGSVGGGEMEHLVLEHALNALKDGKPRRVTYNLVDPERGDPGVCGGMVEVYVEPFLPEPTLVVVGGGHVGKAVAHLGKWLGFRVAVSDDRPEFCTPEANPDADAFYPVPLSELSDHLTITSQTFLVLTTRGVSVDVDGLPALLESQAGYIGVIGSKRRWATALKQLREQGVPDGRLARVHSPIGLELKAETPEEIAVSILAEIIMLRNGGTGKSMKN